MKISESSRSISETVSIKLLAVPIVLCAAVLGLLACNPPMASADSPSGEAVRVILEDYTTSFKPWGLDKLEVHASSCESGITSVSGHYAGESALVVTVERSLDPHSWELVGQSSDGLSTSKDTPAGTVQSVKQNFVKLDRAADRMVGDQQVGQSFRIDWEVNPTERAFYHVQVSTAEQSEGAEVLSLPVVASEYCGLQNDIEYYNPLAGK